MLEDYKKYYYGRTDMTMLNDEKVYGSLGINLKKITTIVEGVGSLMLPNSLKAPLERVELIGNSTQLTTTGKNLLNSSVYTQGYLASIDTGQKISLNTEAKSFTTSMDVSSMVGENISISVQTKEKTGKKYAFTDETDVIINGRFDAGRNTYSKFQNIQVPQNAKKLYFSVTYDVQENTELLVELGAKVTTYEPYTGGKPSPSPEYQQEIKSAGKWNKEKQKHEIDVKVTGKNLFDREKARDITNWIIRDGDGYAKFPIYVKKGNEVTFSYTEKLTAGKGFFLGIAQSDTGNAVGWLYHSTEINLISNKFTVVAQGDFLYLSCNKSSIQKFVDTIQTLQVEIGSEQTAYQPYTEQTLTLTSDRPITKWDKLVDQGGEYGWLYGSKIYVVTGNEVFESRDGYNIESYTNRFFILNDLLKENDALKPLAYMKCLRNVQYVYSPNIFEEGFETNINQFHIKLSNDRVGILASDDHAVRTAKFSEYMKKIHKNGNPIEILYATTDTVFLPLPQSEQTQLRNLHSYNGTTYVFVDSGEVPCGIKVEYVVGV